MIKLFEQDFAVKQALRAAAKKGQVSGAVMVLRECGCDKETIIKKIMESFDISREETEYWLNEEDEESEE